MVAQPQAGSRAASAVKCSPPTSEGQWACAEAEVARHEAARREVARREEAERKYQEKRARNLLLRQQGIDPLKWAAAQREKKAQAARAN